MTLWSMLSMTMSAIVVGDVVVDVFSDVVGKWVGDEFHNVVRSVVGSFTVYIHKYKKIKRKTTIKCNSTIQNQCRVLLTN